MIGLVWGNAFEYAYHRWMLHRRRSSFAKGHLEHHGTIGAPEEAEHVTLGRSPFHIALLFASNGVFVIVLDLLLGLGLMPGIFVGWTVYLIAAEEIHWRIHMEGWLPPGLGFARAYHMSHHDIPNTRYNVFLPLCDFLLRNSRLPRASHGLKQRSRKRRTYATSRRSRNASRGAAAAGHWRFRSFEEGGTRGISAMPLSKL